MKQNKGQFYIYEKQGFTVSANQGLILANNIFGFFQCRLQLYQFGYI